MQKHHFVDHRFLAYGLALLSVVSGLSCGGEKGSTAPPSPVLVLTNVTVSLPTATLQVGQTTSATATGADQNGGPIPTGTVTWSSSATGIATITSTGLVTAIGVGQSTISATTSTRSGQATLTVVPSPATQIAISAGNNQSATVGTAVATAPSVIVKDAAGNAVGGVAVTFAVSSGGGSLTGGSQNTNTSGIATLGSWTLGSTAQLNTLTASALGLAGSPLTFSATGVAGSATQIAVNAGNNQSATIGTTVATAPSVIVKDAAGNAVGNVPVTFAIGAGGGSIAGATQATNSSGIASVGSWTLGGAAGTNTLIASAPGLAGSPVTFSATGLALVMQGALYAADGSNIISSMRLRVAHSDGRIDSTDVQSDGTFALALASASNSELADIYFDARDTRSRTYLPLLRSQVRLDTSLAIRGVLVPVNWTVTKGSFAGQRVTMSVNRAYGARTETVPFLGALGNFRSVVPASMSGHTLVSWPDSAFPIPVAFTRSDSGWLGWGPLAPITAQDSSAFWAAARQFESIVGRSLLSPAGTRNFPPRTQYPDTMIVLIQTRFPGQASLGNFRTKPGGCATNYVWCDFDKASMSLSPETIGNAGLIQHELFHLLGLGHTCNFTSIMYYPPQVARCDAGSVGQATQSPSPSDVAYWELLRATKGIARRVDATWNFMETVNGERRFMLGLNPY